MRKFLCFLATVIILMLPSYAADTVNEVDTPITVSTEMIANYCQGIGTANVFAVNIRENPTIESKVIDVLYKNNYVIVFDKVGDWYCINYEDKIGYVYSKYLDLQESGEADLGFGEIEPEVANIRENPTVESKQIGAIFQKEVVSITGVSNNWYKIKFKDNTEGYIRSDLIDPTILEPVYEELEDAAPAKGAASASEKLPSAYSGNYNYSYAQDTKTENSTDEDVSNPSEDNDYSYDDSDYNDNDNDEDYSYDDYEDEGTGADYSSSTGDYIVETAKQYLGTPYVWGGTSPSGFDCSGFVQYVFRECGYSISRTATPQYSDGTPVSYSNLTTGDLVFFERTYATDGISHVGIYIDGGDFIHCANGGVKISNLTESYYSSRYYGACRII